MTLDEAINLGRAALTRDDIALAESTARQILQQLPNDLRAIDLLGNVAIRRGAYEQAAQIFRKALELAPQGAELHYNLAISLLRLSDFVLAETHFRRALQLGLDCPPVHKGLSNALESLGKAEEAIVHARRAVELEPKSAPLWLHLGKLLSERDDFPPMEEAFRRAIEADPFREESSTRFAGLLWSAGRQAESSKVLRDFLAIQPNAPQAHSRLLFDLNYTPGIDPAAVFQEHLAFAEKYETQYRALTRPPRVARAKIRIGFVSTDFHAHAIAHFLISLLNTIDRSRFEVFCYPTLMKQDLLTDRYRALADHWVDITQMSGDQAADRIRADGIDCLIDLGGHSPGARLLIFARKPAPMQITWLGYLGTTGLRSMDFRITDPYLETEQGAKFYTEPPLMLPKTYWCYDLLNNPPAIEQREADTASITFASLSNFGKYAPGVLATWAELLSRMPGSQLLLHSRYRGVEEAAMAPFLACGIERRRIEFIETQPLDDYLKTYQRIDVALDPFPYGGGTTTCGALWMGVPVVTLAGDAPSSRTGVSILSNVGLPELIATTTDEYIERAIAATEKVGEYRRTMRERMAKSPLMDAPAFARDFGDAVVRALS